MSHPVVERFRYFLSQYDRKLGLKEGTLDNLDVLGMTGSYVDQCEEDYDNAEDKRAFMDQLNEEEYKVEVANVFDDEMWAYELIEEKMSFREAGELLMAE